MIKKLIAAVVVLSFGAVFAGAELSGDVFTIDVGTGEELQTVIPEGATSVVKTGAGKAILTGAPAGTFTGTVTVNAGTLASPSVRYLGTVSKVTVVSGATLDLTDETRTLADNFFTHETTLEIGGSGVDGQGALVRTKSINGDDAEGLFCNVTLTDNTVFRAGKDAEGGRWTIGGSHKLKMGAQAFTMNGHTLTVYGDCGFNTDSWGGGNMKLKDPGNIVVADGAVFHIYSLTLSMASGSQAFNGQTMTLGNGSQLHVYMVRPSNNFKWKLIVPEGNTATFLVNGSGQAERNKWAGDIHVDGTLKVNTKNTDFPELLLGKITGTGQIWKGGNGVLDLNTNVTREFGSLTMTSMETDKKTGPVLAGTLAVSNGPGVVVSGRAAIKSDASKIIFENTKTNIFGNLDIGCDADFVNAGMLMITNPATYGPLLTADTSSMRVGTTNSMPNVVRLTGNTHLCGPDFTKPYTLAVGCHSAYPRGCVYVSDGASISNSLCIGENNRFGALYLSGEQSSVYVAPGGTSYRQNIGDSAYGYFSIKDGSVVYRDGYVLLGRNGGRGFIVQESGTATFNSSSLWLSRPLNSSKSHGEYLLRGGTLNAPGSITFLNPDSGSDFYNASAILTVGGGTLAATVDTVSMTVYASTNIVGKNETSFNLNGKGLLKCGQMYLAAPYKAPAWDTAESLYRQASKWYLNFNGGTIQAKKAGEFFMDATHYPTRVTVFEGGATVDTNGKDVSWQAAIEKPYGQRIASVTLPAEAKAANAVLGTTKVLATDGDGAGFTALTEFDEDTRLNTGVVVTCGGFGYTAAPTVVCEKMGNGSVGSWPCTVTMEDAPTSGGFTKKGAGKLTLKGANTWGGTTRIEAGTLEFTHAQGLPTGTLIEIDAAALTDPENEPLIAHTYTGGEIHLKGMSASWGKRSVKIATFTTALATAPTVKVFDAEGHDVTPADCKVKLMSDGTVLTFGNVELLSVTNPDAARGSIEPYGNISVTNGEVVTFTATPNNHALVGWNVDGEFVATSDLEYVYTVDAEKGTLSLSPVFSTNLYVNATSGNDETGDGFTPATAKKTLAAIVALAISGDVIHAAEGDYDEGEMLDNAKGTYAYCATSFADMYSRVKVPDGVTLKADGARERTTIWGRWHSDSQRNGPVYDNSKTVYPTTPNNALRGVALGHDSVLDGFTVKNGCATGSSSNMRDDNVGGGIIGFRASDARPSYVRNCTITGSGERNGAVYGCWLENCYLYGNACTSDGSQCVRSRLVNCLVYNDSNVAFSSHDGIYGSTIIETAGNQTAHIHEFDSTYPVVNSIVIFKIDANQTAYTVNNWHNCVVQMERQGKTILSGKCTNIKTNTLAECLLDANDWYAPKKGSPAIDWGDASLMADVGGVPQADYRGGQRVYNGTVDVGCNEYDWRGDYAADLVSPDIVVTEASPEVVETDGKNVSIPNGATVKLDWPGTSGSYEARFAISGGTLTVTENGKEPVVYTEGGSYVVDAPTADTKLVFSYAGTGSATLLPFLGAYEAKIGTTPYTNFADAYAAVSGSDEITLLKNVTWAPTIDAALKTVSVGKGNFTLTIAPTSVTAFNAKGYVCKFDDTTLKVGLPFAGGAGTAASPWEIGDWETLDLYRQGVLAKTYTTEHVQQTDDIDFTGKSAWLGIGDLFTKAYSDTKVCFVGTYDGAGHRITNVKFVNNKYTGFFQRVGNGTTPGCVKNLTVHTLGFETPEATAEYGGAIVAAGLHNGSIIGVTAEGTFGSETYPISGNSAGIVCRFAAGTIESCTNKATIWASSSKIGGIANIAQADDAGSGTMFEGPNVIAACVNQGAIRHKGEAPADGGFAGILGYSAAKVSATISGCVNEGEITSTSATTLLGQIVGRYIQGVLVIDSGCQVRTDIFALGDVSPKYEVPRPDCLDFATVENGVATLVSTNDLVKGGSYKLMAPLAAYNLRFTTNDVPRENPIKTISFDRSLYAGFEPTVTPAVGVKVTGPAIEGDVLTYTVRRRMGTLMILQ